MARVWIGLIFLCLVAVLQVDGRGGRGGRRGHGGSGGFGWNWSIYFAVLGGGTALALLAACLFARDNHDGAQCFLGIPQRPLMWIANTWVCFAPPLGLLVWICMFIGWEQECELCMKIVSSSEHRYMCPDLDTLASMPNSTFYSCKTCNQPLKLWPVRCLAVSTCRKCKTKIENNGRNLHVCFTCPEKHVSDRLHLCSEHRDVHLQRTVLVDFSKSSEVGTDRFLPSELNTLEETEIGGEWVLTRQPSWQQKISTAGRIAENKPIHIARQASMKLKRMTSTSSTLQNREAFDEERLLPPQRVMVQLVDEQLADLEVPPTELTLTGFSKLLSDLAFYSGVPDVQGLLIKTESGSFAQVFDMDRIPPGNIKVQAVNSDDKHFLRLYPNPQLPE